MNNQLNRYISNTTVAALALGIAAATLVPWHFSNVAPFTAQRIIQWITTCIILATSGYLLRHALYIKISTAFHKKPLIITATVLTLSAASTLLSPMPKLAFLELSYLTLLAALTLLIAACTPQISDGGWRLTSIILSLLLLFYSVLATDHISLTWGFANRHDFGPGFSNVRFFADVATGVMPLSLLYIVARPRPSWEAAALIALPLSIWWWMLWVSESRSALLSILTSATLTFCIFGRAARWPVATILTTALIGLAGWWLLNPLTADDADYPFLRDIASSSGRLSLWVDALRYSWQSFPIGIGPMGFSGDGYLRSAHAHNIFLNTAAEWGIPLAAALFLTLSLLAINVATKSKNIHKEKKPIYACTAMAFFSTLINLQFAGAQVMPASAMTVALSFGLAAGFQSKTKTSYEHRSSSKTLPLKGTILWCTLMLMVYYMAIAGVELYNLSLESTMRCFELTGSFYQYPRFWLQGRLECMQDVAPQHWLFQ